MKLPRITGLVGLQSDGKGTVTFQFESNDGRSHYVPMKVGVINALLAPILSVRDELSAKNLEENDGFSGVALTGVRPAIDDQRRCILELNLDGLPLRVVIPRSGIRAFQASLTQLDELAESVATGTKH